MAVYLKQHLELWFAIAIVLVLLDFIFFKIVRGQMLALDPHMASKIHDSHAGKTNLPFVRFIFTRQYARLGNARLKFYGDLILVVRVIYLSWFIYGFWILIS